MAITPNTDFSVNQVLTASQMNRFARGVMGLQSITTIFTTAATHTTYQDNGATLTFTEVSGRLYRINYHGYVYPSGGLQGINLRFVRNGVELERFLYAAKVLDAGNSLPTQCEYVYQSTANGSATFKVQMAAAASNTAVSDYGAATDVRQFWIEDIGAA